MANDLEHDVDAEREISEEEAVPQGTSPAAPSPRGQFWEITYRKVRDTYQPWILDKTALKNDTGKCRASISAVKDLRAVNLSKKKFDECDINHFELSDSSFSESEFTDCRFIKANFTGVKFSRCTFRKCHFLNTRFVRCQFIGCTFSEISASAEQLHFVESTISAHDFTSALVTNLVDLPPNVTAEYQQHRFLAAKAKIARAIFLSVRDEPDLDLVFDAIQCFELSLQRSRIAEARWQVKAGRLASNRFWSRVVIRYARTTALWVLQGAGFLTDWGRSPAKSLWVQIVAIPAFAIAYAAAFSIPITMATMRALDCTFVFGYTRYAITSPTPATLDWVTFANALVGFSWYALLIPALSKRIFR